jgi:hypothetical protein
MYNTILKIGELIKTPMLENVQIGTFLTKCLPRKFSHIQQDVFCHLEIYNKMPYNLLADLKFRNVFLRWLDIVITRTLLKNRELKIG